MKLKKAQRIEVYKKLLNMFTKSPRYMDGFCLGLEYLKAGSIIEFPELMDYCPIENVMNPTADFWFKVESEEPSFSFDEKRISILKEILNNK